MARRVKKHFGYRPNRAATARFLANQPFPEFGALGLEPKRDQATVLYRPVIEVIPDWQRGSQAIGDCVSWGFELGCTALLAAQAATGEGEIIAEVATEAIYGGARVEGQGKDQDRGGDGTWGSAAAEWVKKYGVNLRIDYSERTGNSDHDLTRYSGNRAQSWGRYGCGGKSDRGKLDAIAREHPVRTVSLVTSFDQAAAAIANGYPVPVCSGQGFTSQRDRDGFCYARGSWSHCMLFWGVRHDRPGLLCTNSWGHSVDGPTWDEEGQPEAIAACSWWVDARTADRMLSGRDSFALSDMDGFPGREIDFSWPV